jgi:hypothetical protein
MTRPGRTGRRKLTFSWRVDCNWSGFQRRRRRRADRVVEHRRLERPERVAGGSVNASVAANASSILSASTSAKQATTPP